MKSKIILLVVQLLAALAAGYYVVLFLYIAISRIAFPFPFDWVEGAVLVQANRVLLGQAMFVEPGAAYVPLAYQPLYFYAAAAFIKLFGLGMFAPRLLSLLASCGCMLMIFLITRKLTGANLFALISAGLFAATNGIVWTWFDFAKVDMLCIFFMLAGLYCLLRDDKRGAALAGVLLMLSFFTKQSTGPLVALIFACLLLTKRQQAFIFIAVFGILSVAWGLLLNAESNGLYYFYVVTLPSYHRLNTSQTQVNYVLTSILQPIWIVLGMTLLSMGISLKKFIHDSPYRFFAILAGGALVLSILLALGAGATRNAFIPAYALIAIVFGLSLHNLQENIAQKLTGNFRLIGSMLLLGVCLLQFSFLQYKTKDYIPTAQDSKRGNALMAYLKKADGEFLIPTQNYLALYVNKPVYYHAAPLGEFDGWYGKPLPQWAKIKAEITGLVHTKKVNVIYMEKPAHTWLNMTCQKIDVFKSNSKFVPTLYKMVCD